MDKKLVSLYIPAIQERFDLFVPVEVDIATLVQLLSRGVAELCKGRYVPSGQGLLTLCNPDLLLCPERSLADYAVENGARLILF